MNMEEAKDFIEAGDFVQITITEDLCEWGVPKSFAGQAFWGQIKGEYNNEKGKKVYCIEYKDDVGIFWLQDIVIDAWDHYITRFLKRQRVFQLLEECGKQLDEEEDYKKKESLQ